MVSCTSMRFTMESPAENDSIGRAQLDCSSCLHSFHSLSTSLSTERNRLGRLTEEAIASILPSECASVIEKRSLFPRSRQGKDGREVKEWRRDDQGMRDSISAKRFQSICERVAEEAEDEIVALAAGDRPEEDMEVIAATICRKRLKICNPRFNPELKIKDEL